MTVFQANDTQSIKPSVKVAFLMPNQCWSSTAISPMEIVHALNLNPQIFDHSHYGGFTTQFLRTTRSEITNFVGLPLQTRYFGDPVLKDEDFDVVLIPSIWNLSMENLTRSHLALTWLNDQHQRGALVVGLVTGVFYLAEAGLLNGRQATIHWASKNIFQQRYPKVDLNSQLEMIEADRVITTASTPATFDVALTIIQRFIGNRAAEYASHYLKIRGKNAPLPDFLESSCNDALVDAARDILRLNYQQELSLEVLAKQINTTARTLSRRFLNATGMSPIQYLIRQRLNEARRLLQSTDLQIQQVAEKTGFGSATVFCRHFKAKFKQTPRAYRANLPTSR